ncbi:MAG: gamma-glutamylcyclotransferase [Sedimenticola sp.]|nr:gamma-glutamylcyclotransferase [Sedimenticola sp.]
MCPYPLFVYGSLLKGVDHPYHRHLARYCEYLGPGRLQGRLFEVNGYPGAITSDQTDEWVTGELYGIQESTPLFLILDEYEGCSDDDPLPHEYQRVLQPILLEDGSQLTAWTYCYAGDTSRLQQITSGDYLAYRYRQHHQK